MRSIRTVGTVIVCMALMTLISGCSAGYQARKVDLKQSALVNPDLLTEGTGDEALYKYRNPKADLKSYTKILVEPVLVKKDGQLDSDALKNYQTLANNAYVYLSNEMRKDYPLVEAPEPGTIRIQMAIIDADSASAVSNTLSTFLPIGMAVSLVKYSAVGKESGVGEITVEMRVTDAVTGELLAAALDRRVGGKQLNKLWSSWANADDALKYWSQRLRFVLCQTRGNVAKCVKPGEE